MKSDAVASVERYDDDQQEKIAQADEFAMQILIPATDSVEFSHSASQIGLFSPYL